MADVAAMPGRLTLDYGEAVWDEVVRRTRALEAAWRSAGDPPQLDRFLPVEPAGLRALVARELVKVDLEQRWKRGASPRLLEWYAAEFPEICIGGQVPIEMVYDEYHARAAASEESAARDCLARFPEFETELRDLVGSSVSMTRSRRGAVQDLPVYQPGQIVDDFQIVQKAGEGAFGCVYLARQLSMQRTVALKVTGDRGDDEPQVLAQMDHEGIVRVFDQRRLSEPELRLLYTEFMPGGTLAGVIKAVAGRRAQERGGRDLLACVDGQLQLFGQMIPGSSHARDWLRHADWCQTVSRLGAQMARGLAHAHSRGVLHRDIKPANVLLGIDAAPRLADFNISYAAALDGSTAEAFFGGSLAYMSPEQLLAFRPGNRAGIGAIDARSDLYSLAVVLWELLHGERPFPAEEFRGDWGETIDAMLATRRTLSLRQRARFPDHPLSEALLQTLVFDREQRLTSGADLAARLELGTDPQVIAMLRQSRHGWRALAARFPAAWMTAAFVLPNIPAAMFNYTYNRNEIVARFAEGTWLPSFWNLQSVVNAIAFPGSVALALWLLRPALRLIRQRCRNVGERERGVYVMGRMAEICGAVVLGAWLIAGIVYPISLTMMSGTFPLESGVHFLISLTICGLIAVAYPCLLVCGLTANAFVPRLMQSDPAAVAKVELPRITAALKVSLCLAAVVPMLTVSALSIVTPANRFALVTLSATGAVGFVLAFWLFTQIERSLQTLQRMQAASQPQSASGR